MLLKGVLLCLVLWGTAACLAAADWPMFRADVQRSARSDDVDYARSWPDGGPPLVWRRDDLGRTRSSPVVADGVLYLLGDDGLLALDAATGAPRWHSPGGPKGSTPVVSGARIVLLDGAHCRAYAVKDGAQLWQCDLGDVVDGLDEWDVKYDGWSQSPLVVDDRVIIAVGHPEVPAVALSLSDGSLLWRATPTEARAARYRSYASSLFTQRGGTPLVIAHFGIVVAGLHAGDGRVLWEYTTNVEDKFRRTSKLAIANCCVLADDLLISISSRHYGGPNQQSALRLTDDGTGVEPAWHNPVLRPHQEGALLLDGLLYGTGSVTYEEALRAEHPVLVNGGLLAETHEALGIEIPRKHSRPVRMPDARKYGYGIVCQEADTGRVRGVRYGLRTGGWGGGFCGHVLVGAGERIIALPTSLMQEAWLLEPGPAMAVVGKIAFPPGEHRKGKADQGDDDRWSTPAIAGGLGFFRLNDIMLVYDLRAR